MATDYKYNDIIVENHEGIGIIYLNRPDKKIA